MFNRNLLFAAMGIALVLLVGCGNKSDSSGSINNNGLGYCYLGSSRAGDMTESKCSSLASSLGKSYSWSACTSKSDAYHCD
jgi:uncharacterized lipoprotein NlpE involved in copper resistance